MRFIDEAVIRVRSGAGGDGCVSFRREKFVPRGGPDGGDGGDGGSVVLAGRARLQTLADLEYRHSYKAGRGRHGTGSGRHGRNGEGVTVPVPLGTDVFSRASGVRLGELLEEGQELVVARGGRGGRGNARFATSTNRAPRNAEPGGEAAELELKLVLRLVADIGFVGLPNAGKSTLLSALTSANPKVAAYPFTTLAPNLGVMQIPGAARRESSGRLDEHVFPARAEGPASRRVAPGLRFTVADLPGIIEGAHAGRGLGLRFLRHIERTKMLVFVIDCAAGSPVEDYRLLCGELREYDPAILDRPRVVALNKTDLLDHSPADPGLDAPAAFVSALERTGIAGLQALVDRHFPR